MFLCKKSAFCMALGALFLGSALAMVYHKPARSDVPFRHFELYEPQKVVYHVHKGGGFFGSHNRDLVAIMNNHMRAVGDDYLDLRLVLQGDGIEILQAATKDEKLAASIRDLRKRGVKFLICYNTLAGHGIDFRKDLFEVKQEDIVAAGVAEVARLEREGFVYLKF
ncbi:MAG: DsrE family protein [Beijerinckiaceae bacterium]